METKVYTVYFYNSIDHFKTLNVAQNCSSSRYNKARNRDCLRKY